MTPARVVGTVLGWAILVMPVAPAIVSAQARTSALPTTPAPTGAVRVDTRRPPGLRATRARSGAGFAAHGVSRRPPPRVPPVVSAVAPARGQGTALLRGTPDSTRGTAVLNGTRMRRKP